MNSGSFAVDPTALDTYAGTLDTRVTEVRAAADKVGAANGFDFNAFGAVMGQVLAIPSRIALKVVQDKVNGLAGSLEEAARTVRDTAKSYRDTDSTNGAAFTGGNSGRS